MTFAVTRPRLYVIIVQDKPGDIEKLIQLAISLLLWAWLHKDVLLQAAEVVGKIGDVVSAGREAYLSLFMVLLMPARFNLGIG